MNKILKGFYIFLILVAIFAAGAVAGRHFVHQHLTFVATIGESMMPTLPNQAVYEAAPPTSLERGDIVTLIDVQGTMICKRIVGMPGETIGITNGIVYLNGQVLHEPYLAKNSKTSVLYPAGPEIKAGDGYIVMGDNRQVSYDSRAFGPVKFSDIKEKLRIYTLEAKPETH